MVKIHSDHPVEAVTQEQARVRTPGTQTGQAFGDFLSQEVTKTSGPAGQKAAALPPPGGLFALNPLTGVQATAPVDPAADAEAEVAQSVEKVLDEWAGYAAELGGQSEGGLKAAYGRLEAAASQTAELKSRVQDMAEASPGLKEILGDLESMLTAERFKFNRGDYL